MKLWKVRTTIEAVVASEFRPNPSEARRAITNELNHGGGLPDDATATPIESVSELPDGWEDAMPWDHLGSETCREILEGEVSK